MSLTESHAQGMYRFIYTLCYIFYVVGGVVSDVVVHGLCFECLLCVVRKYSRSGLAKQYF